MYRVITNISIVQQPTKDFPNRKKTLSFNFCNHYECSDNWRDLTNKGKIIIPKNLYARDANNKLVQLFGTNVNIGGFGKTEPLFLRGDKVKIDSGYKFLKNGREIYQGTYDNVEKTSLFEGYISNVSSKIPMEFEVQDNMWKLKQIPAPIKVFKATDTLENILTTLLSGTEFTVNALTKTTFGEFRIGNETVCDVLLRLRKEFHFESYFRGNELRCGSIVYLPEEAKEHNFTFQKNIISDELQYKRKDDIVLSAVVSNTIEEDTGKTTKDGEKKTKRIRLEALVTLQYGSDEPIVFIKKKGEQYPPNTGGERRTLFYPGAFTIEALKNLAVDELKKYYYTGFKGKFTTFGIPFVKMGDNVRLTDPLLPERNGLYKVRGVEYNGGVQGLRQIIELDFKLLL
jgi:hypothetical protein